MKNFMYMLCMLLPLGSLTMVGMFPVHTRFIDNNGHRIATMPASLYNGNLGSLVEVGFEIDPGVVVCPEILEWPVPVRLAQAVSRAQVRQFLVRRQLSGTMHCAGSCLANAMGVTRVVEAVLPLDAISVVREAPYSFELTYQRELERIGESVGLDSLSNLLLAHTFFSPDCYVLVTYDRVRQSFSVLSVAEQSRLIEAGQRVAQYIRSLPDVTVHFQLCGAVQHHAVLVSLVKRQGSLPVLIYMDSGNIPMAECQEVEQYISYIYQLCLV